MLLGAIIAVLVLYIFLGIKNPRFALISMLFVCPFFVIIFVVNELMAETITAVCILPVVLFSVLCSRTDLESPLWPKDAARTVLFMIMCIALTAMFFAKLGPAGFYFLLLEMLFFGYYIGAVATAKNAMVAFVISTIAASVRQNLPLSFALQSAAENSNSRHSLFLRRIAKWLVQGFSLSEAIKKGFKECPAKIIAMIELGEKNNQLPNALEVIERDMLKKADDSRAIEAIHYLPYFFVVIDILLLIMLGVSLYIVPKFAEVIKEMSGGDLPRPTRILMAVSNFIAFRYGWVIIIAPIFLTGVLLIIVKFRNRRPNRPRLLSRMGDFFKWHLPIIHWFENNYSLLQTLEGLKISFNAGSTVNGAIQNAVNLDINYCFRKKLKKWLTKVEAGENIAKASKQSGLAKSVSWAFEQQGDDENMRNILQLLEEVYRSNYSYRVNLAKFILMPTTIVCIGSMVGFFAYAIFSAIIAVITQLVDLV
jgi:type IV pilus assembly protein PilC